MKNALFERYTSTNIKNKMSMPYADGDESFHNKVSAMNGNNNFIGRDGDINGQTKSKDNNKDKKNIAKIKNNKR